jgi:hypothetical protein
MVVMMGVLMEIAPYAGIAGGIIVLASELHSWRKGVKRRPMGFAVMALIGIYLITLGTAQLLVRRGFITPEAYPLIIWLFSALIGGLFVYGLIKERRGS